MSKDYIWNKLRSQGFSEYATAGIMGNIQAESAFLSNNVQDGYGYTDEDYTRSVDDGSYSNFVHDSIGYGLCQWTYWSRKQGLLNFCKERGVSIGDEDAQLDYLYKELSTEYPEAFNEIMNAESTYEATYAFCVKFERPADMYNQAVYRNNYSEQIYNEYAGSAVEDVTVPLQAEESTAAETETDSLHVVRWGDKTWYGNAVQSLLKAHGYDLKVDKDVRDITMNALQDFASRNGIDAEEDFGQLIYLLFSE